MTNTVNTETRRKSERTKVASNEIVYLHFQTGNGGIVLDVSAEGLGFQAADPLQADESLSFRLSVPGFPEIALAGQIVWLDPTRKRGGMRLRVPAESAALFRQWQHKYLDSAAGADIPDVPRRDRAPEVAARPASRMESRIENRAAPPARAATRDETPSVNSAPPPQPEPPRTSPPPPNPFARRNDSMLGGHGPIFVSEWEAPPEPPRTGRNILVACVIIGLCAVIAGGSYYLAGKRVVGNMLINLGQQIGGANKQASATAPQAASGSQAVPATTAPNALPAPLPQNAPAPNAAPGPSPATAANAQPAPANTLPPQSPADASAANAAAAPPATTPTAAPEANASSIPADVAASEAKLSQSDLRDGSPEVAAPPPPAHRLSGAYPGAKPKQVPRPPAPATDNGDTELNQALTYLRSSSSQESAVAEELLWSAVGKGNTQADLVLGDLYMRGQGAVRRNCRQAEVLLHAALVADVPGADEKLGELQTYGCH